MVFLFFAALVSTKINFVHPYTSLPDTGSAFLSELNR